MTDLGYLEAWQMWFAGDPALKDATMHGLGTLWWGRFGKIAAFFGGMTVVLDIIGPARIRGYGARLRAIAHAPGEHVRRAFSAAGLIAGLFAAIPLLELTNGFISWFAMTLLLSVAVVVAAALFEGQLSDAVPNGVAWLLEHPRTLTWWRVISLVALLVGFHFDLLAS
ncbi:hypothetical protein [Nonomuraea dietziae]|uniref:hypothetical protein n=1 Tax=Nonomuraea dietziae TaxID=65515 RepID=UPI0033EF5F1A